jgi:hypothetical protein
MTDPLVLLQVHGSTPLLILEADPSAAADAAWGWRESGLTVRAVRRRNAEFDVMRVGKHVTRLGNQDDDADVRRQPVHVREALVECRPVRTEVESGEWWDRPAVPFHVVLQSPSREAAAVRARWRAADAEISEFPS